MNFRPCIDVFKAKVVQLIGTSLFGGDERTIIKHFESEYSPAYYAKLFKEDDLKGGHILSLGSGNNDVVIEALSAFSGGMKYGGGVTAENAHVYLDAGATHVIVNSYVFNNGEINYSNLDSLVKSIGKDKLVLDMSCRKRNGEYYIVTNLWEKFTNVRINKQSLLEISGYCDEIIVHGVDSEGRKQGLESDLVKILAEHTPIKTVYAGGISSISDLNLIKELGNEKIDPCIGTALSIYGGNLPYQDVVQWNNLN
ncbi:phosphoribosylformimino-5-aminoimidazole carboxamide ribotide isomerase [Sphingobacterium corticibacter]|uniref:Phosphoribosylformimino-5-aminoimidazole carboxamide ribotide isomerase n=1 Tax=Sphingobacterium corticibacter TaxID=2171749 RepID=A0A2T8HGV2_9SPHI|nr:phosphoribosylformimino-5-aminoimidazole carboxamide ribotide isomerase [Sphingobacterium corticibacter]PVH24623.1 phosphoribosylformimino-5-aminoimidazole carboxamide ribotide isomerase [Sphingobacterium corticibacter]